MITMLGENASSGSPSQQDLVAWADAFGLTHPVVADPGFEVTARFVAGNSIGLPSMSLIEAGGEVLYADSSIGEDEVERNLPD